MRTQLPITTAAVLSIIASLAFAQFPAERTITDTTGRKLEATVLSQGNGVIKIRRKSDGKEFDFPLAKLSMDDRRWLDALKEKPDEEKPDPFLDKDAPPSPPPTPPTPNPEPTKPVAPSLPAAPAVITSKEIYEVQDKSGVVPPPLGWDALKTFIRFKDGTTIFGYVYEVKDDKFWYAAEDMIQKSATFASLSAQSRVEILKWRQYRAPHAGSPSVELIIDGKSVYASVLHSDGKELLLLTEGGEFMEKVPLSKLDEASQKFVKEWDADNWKPDLHEWAVKPEFTAVRPFIDRQNTLAKRDGKWGVIDSSGSFVSETRFDEIAETGGKGNVKVREKDKWGLMVDGARLAIPPAWEDVGDLYHGLIAVRSDGKWGYAAEGGKLVIPCTWDDAWRFSAAGLAVVSKGEKRGFIDRSGKAIVKPEWDGAIIHTPEGIGAVRRGKGWALIDRNGRLLCEPNWIFRWEDRRFELGYIPAWPVDGVVFSTPPSGGTLAEVEQSQQILLGIDGKPNAVAKLQSGVCPAQQPGFFLQVHQGNMPISMKDRSGQDIQIYHIGETHGGLTVVRAERPSWRYGFADRNGLVVAPQWASLGHFFNGASVASGVADDKEGSRNFSLINAEGKEVLPAGPGSLSGPVGSVTVAYPAQPLPKTDEVGKRGLIDLRGKTILKAEWDQVDAGVNKLIRIRRDDKWGLADETGKVLVEPVNDEIFVLNPELVAIQDNSGKNTVLNVRNGKVLLDRFQFWTYRKLPNGCFGYRIGKGAQTFWADGAATPSVEGATLEYVDHYGKDMIFREGSPEEPQSWWIADEATRKIRKFEDASHLYWEASLAEHGRIWMQDKATGTWHFCSIDGKRLGPVMAEKPDKWMMKDGLGFIRENGTCHFIDKDGKRIDDKLWEDVEVSPIGMTKVKKGGLWGLMDSKGALVVECSYGNLAEYNDGGGANRKILYYMGFKPGGEPDSFDTMGKAITTERRQQIPDERRNLSADGKWRVVKGGDGRFGINDETGKTILEAEWSEIKWVGDNVAVVSGLLAGGLYSPVDGWLLKDGDEQRIMRNKTGELHHPSASGEFVFTEQSPKWGFARWKKSARGELLAGFDFNGDSRDISDGGKDAVAHNVTWVEDKFGKANSAVLLDGQTSYLECPININPRHIPLLTMTAWVRSDGGTSNQHVITNDDGGYDRSLCIFQRGGNSGWCAFAGFGRDFGFHPVKEGEWVFLAAVFDQKSQMVTLRVNDQVYEKKGGFWAGSTSLFIGKNPVHGHHFKGAIDQIRLYDRLLNKEEIDLLYREFLGEDVSKERKKAGSGQDQPKPAKPASYLGETESLVGLSNMLGYGSKEQAEDYGADAASIRIQQVYPYAKEVPGKPGFAFSPYNNKLVDVRGISKGSLVYDPTFPPSDKKFFRVP